MQVLLVTIARWLFRHLLSLVLITVVLLAGRAGWIEWQEWQATTRESKNLIRARQDINDSLQKLVQEINGHAAKLRTDTLANVEARINEVDSEIARRRLERQQLGGVAAILAGQPFGHAQLQALQIDGGVALLQKEHDWLQELKLRLLATQSATKVHAELGRVRVHRDRLYGDWQTAGLARDALERKYWARSRLPGTDEYQRVQALTGRRAQLVAEIRGADDVLRGLQNLLNNPVTIPPLATLPLAPSAVEAVLQPLYERMDELGKVERSNWVGQFWRAVRDVLPTAMIILLGAMLTPVAIKALFYFLLAPLAASRPPVQVLPEGSGALTLETGRSSVSRAITIDDAHELLVHPEFLQSVSFGGEKTTQWLLSWQFALTSLSAGMVALTRIRCDKPETVVISPTRDALAEIGVLDLPDGSAVVMQPHNLVGVIQPRDKPLRITAHWRLTSLHSWLTLQLRYLALHGPVRLLVQGCRGVRVEPTAGGRAINQAATIAFSANAPYSTRRCETFAAYLLGRQELLNDCFGSPVGESEARDAGFFVYQELPHANRRAGITGRGLEGLTDSVLKVLGV